VDPALIKECLRVALQAPSGSNKQTWHFVAVTDAVKRAALADLYRRSFEIYRSSATNSARLFADSPERSAAGARVFDSAEHLAENLHRIPVLLIPVIAGRCEEKTTAHAQANYWAGIIPAVWSFMLAARERGLGTCWTSMHLRYEREAADILGIPADRFTQVALVPVAHTLGTSFREAPRQPLDEVLHVDGW
jgi:nitroreductase